MSGILLSKEHGVNPSILKCFLCGEDIGVALLGKLPGDKEAPREIYTGELCDRCKKALKKGYAFIEVIVNKGTPENPYRTGRFVVLKEESLIQPIKDSFGKQRIAYMDRSEFETMFGETFKNKKEEDED